MPSLATDHVRQAKAEFPMVNGGVTSYESTVSYTFDGGSRMTQVVDTAGGTITKAYDNLDRLTTETTAQGSISYGYDNAGRRTSMTVAGQPQVSYSYDNANRLTQIAQGTSNVGFSYDNANRRSSLTLPNGVSVSYAFDNDSRITGITYNFGANTLGNLNYTYDSLGRRTQVGGSFARTSLPGAVSSTTYDAANELTNWNGTAISYDSNGNMQSDGANVFTWNARNQVATLNSVSLQYDALGRRIKNAAGTSFVFDGPNASQELSGSTVAANIWTGGLDEILQRTDANGTVVPLTDALGSVLALADSNGNLVTQYSYDPFGNTTTAGAVSTNPSQYTGRENEGNGLYYLRARYYSPLLHRFISEDPLGFGGGLNQYAYVEDDPINFDDPLGLKRCLAWWQRTLVVVHAGAGATVGVSKVIVAVGGEVETGGLATPVATYVGLQGIVNTLGALGEAYNGVMGNGDKARFANNIGVGGGTISGLAQAVNYQRRYPDSKLPEQMQAAAEAGQFENMLSGFLINPTGEGTVKVLEVTLGLADALGADDLLFNGRGSCGCN